MWRKEDGSPQAPSAVPPSSRPPAGFEKPEVIPSSSQPLSSKAPACVSQGIKIKGEVTGNEDLFVDGVIEGKISLTNSTVTIGPNGTVKAEISARDVVLRGTAEGKFTAAERIQIWHSARVEGELKAERISIEDGAELRGRVEAGKMPGSGKATETAGHGKKSDSGKTKDMHGKDTKDTSEAPGAATARAD